MRKNSHVHTMKIMSRCCMDDYNALRNAVYLKVLFCFVSDGTK